MKYVVWLIILAVVVGGGYVWWHQREVAAAASSASAVATAKVEYNDIKVSVQSTGAVASNRDVDIKCKASGNIKILPYTDVSASVAPDALLMQLDTIDEDRALESANAVVDADNARLQEAQLNWQIAKMNLDTTRTKDNADLALGKAQLEDAKNKLLRTQELFESKLESKEDVETAQTTEAQADAAVQTASAAIEELKQSEIAIDTKFQEIAEMKAQLNQDITKQKSAQTNVDYCKVTAPPADPGQENDPPQWRISKMTAGVEVGYLVQSGSSGASGGTTVMTLSDLSHLYVLATVDESDIGSLLVKFGAGQELPVRITADAYPGIEFSGKVVRIATIGVNTSNVVTFEVKIEVTSANRGLLRPIMTANVDIIRAERTHVLTVPVQAVIKQHLESSESQPATVEAVATTEEASGGSSTTRPGKKGHRKHDAMPKSDDKPTPGTVTLVKADGSTEQRDVMVGLSDDTSYEVISGLEEGDVVELNKMGADSKWHGGGGRGGANGMMRGIGR